MMNERPSKQPRLPIPSHTLTGGRPARHRALLALVLVLLLASASTLVVMGAGAQPFTGRCNASGKNAQCTEFGEIWMDSRADINGERVTLQAEIMVYNLFENQQTRWILFSVRNTTGDSHEPVSVDLRGFSTPNGDLITSREERKSNQVDLWVDVLDLPTNTPITITVRVGAAERGAFVLEGLVMAFDRGYSPVTMSNGEEAVLFSFTLLGVSKESGSSGMGTRLGSIPAPGFLAAFGVLAILGLIAQRRRDS